MNEIGVFLSEENVITSFEVARYVKIFVKEKELWRTSKIILINRTSGKKSINEIRQEYKNIIKEMDDCKIIVVREAAGIPYSVFYMEDFSIWELEGNPYDFFDEIIDKEIKEEETAKEKVEVGKKLIEGYYLIDLQELELTHPELSSKKAIIPYLENSEVEKIEVHCCHVPPWLIAKKDRGELSLEITKIKINDYKVIVGKK